MEAAGTGKTDSNKDEMIKENKNRDKFLERGFCQLQQMDKENPSKHPVKPKKYEGKRSENHDEIQISGKNAADSQRLAQLDDD